MFRTKVAKVAALQFVTVLLQAFGKLRLLGGIVIFGVEQQAAVQSLQLAFWCFFGLLLWNGLYPSLLFIFPNSTWCRYNSAMMDVVLDLGYVLTYLVMVVLGMSELSLKASCQWQLWRPRRTEVQQQYLTKFLEHLKFQCHNVSLICVDVFDVLGIFLKDSHMVKLTSSPSIRRY